jgi:hypothetical protein
MSMPRMANAAIASKVCCLFVSVIVILVSLKIFLTLANLKRNKPWLMI